MARIRNEKIGDVFLREFDEGVVKELGGTIIGNDYYLPLNKVPGVEPPLFTEWAEQVGDVGQPMPGIPFIFANPGDESQRYVIPCIRVRREDPSPALERWGSLQDKYRVPAEGEEEKTVQYGNRMLIGYSKYEMQSSGWPYDIPYTITVEANGNKARTNSQVMLKHCLGVFGPYGVVHVVDSFGRTRVYNVFGEGPSSLSSVGDIRDRTMIYALSLRVAGELDVQPSRQHQAVVAPPVMNGHRKE